MVRPTAMPSAMAIPPTMAILNPLARIFVVDNFAPIMPRLNKEMIDKPTDQNSAVLGAVNK